MIDLSKPYGGYEPLRSSALQNRMARAIGAVCFFWMYYRVYHDAPVMMGFKHPIVDHEDH